MSTPTTQVELSDALTLVNAARSDDPWDLSPTWPPTTTQSPPTMVAAWVNNARTQVQVIWSQTMNTGEVPDDANFFVYMPGSANLTVRPGTVTEVDNPTDIATFLTTTPATQIDGQPIIIYQPLQATLAVSVAGKQAIDTFAIPALF